MDRDKSTFRRGLKFGFFGVDSELLIESIGLLTPT